MKSNKRKLRKCQALEGIFTQIFEKYIQQWTMCHFKMYIRSGTFRYNCTLGQLNNNGGGEFHEIKQSRDKTEIGKLII